MGAPYVRDLVKQRLRELKLAGPDWVSKNWKAVPSDPVRLFIKREPHTIEKAKLNRWRLIWSVSVIDQLIDALIWGKMIETEIEKHANIPSKPGWTYLKGGMNQLYHKLKGRPRYGASDKSSFDFTVSEDMLELMQDLGFRTCSNFDPNAEWVQIAKIRFLASYLGYIIFSNGLLIRQNTIGVMRSGSKVTINWNSKLQVAFKIIACLRFYGSFDSWKDIIEAMGDDSLEAFRDEGFSSYYKEFMESVGLIVKFIADVTEITDERIHFCSQRFLEVSPGKMVSQPINEQKHKFNIKMTEGGKSSTIEAVWSTLNSYCIEYAFHPLFEFWYSYLEKWCTLYNCPLYSRNKHKNLNAGYE